MIRLLLLLVAFVAIGCGHPPCKEDFCGDASGMPRPGCFCRIEHKRNVCFPTKEACER